MNRDFNDFLHERLTANRIEEMAGEVNKRLDGLNPISNDRLGTAIGVISAKFAIMILEEYHEWVFGDPDSDK